eukprot:gene10587-14212_t
MAHVSTSYVERQNLTMRMHMRRFTRLTNAFSKKFENHVHIISLYTVFYNFFKIHKTLRVAPGIEAGLSSTVRDFEWIGDLIDARAPKSESSVLNHVELAAETANRLIGHHVSQNFHTRE